MAIVWPSSLPERPGLPTRDELQESRVRSRPDQGPAIVRRRFTGVVRVIEFPIIMTGTERAAFEAFYEDTLDYGVQRFQWVDPVDDATVQYRFVNPPSWRLLRGDSTPADRLWRASLTLEIVPSAFEEILSGIREGAADLTGTASLTAAGTVESTIKEGVAGLTGVGTLTAAGTVTAAAVEGTAALLGTASVSAIAAALRGGAATLQGAATLAAATVMVRGGSVSLTGTASLAAAATVGGVEAVELNGATQWYEMADLGTDAPADGSGWTWHGWRKMGASTDGLDMVLFSQGVVDTDRSVPHKEILRQADGTVRARVWDGAGDLIADCQTTGTLTESDGWTPLGVDVSGDQITIRLATAEDSNNSAPTDAGGYMEHGAKRYIGRRGDDSDMDLFKGCCAEDWEAPTSLGFSDNDTYEQFVDTGTDGPAPRDIGNDGTGPSAEAFAYLNQDYTSYHVNQVSTDADDYSPVGFISACDGPGSYSAQYSPSSGIVLEESTTPQHVNDQFTGQTIDLNYPATVNADDFLIAEIVTDWFDSTTTPTGWTLIERTPNGSEKIESYGRIADGTETGSETFQCAGGGLTQISGAMMRFSGVDVSGGTVASCLDATTTEDTGTDDTPVAPSITTNSDGAAVIRLVGSDGNVHTGSGAPATAIYDDSADAGSGDGLGLAASYAIQATAGASGTASFSLSASQEWAAQTIALKPA